MTLRSALHLTAAAVVCLSAAVFADAMWSDSAATSRLSVPRIQLDANRLELGAVRPGTTSSAEFWITNAGGKRLVLVEAEGGCCGGGIGRRALIAPGARQLLSFAVLSPHEVGNFDETFVWSSNDPDHPTIELTVSGRVSNGTND